MEEKRVVGENKKIVSVDDIHRINETNHFISREQSRLFSIVQKTKMSKKAARHNEQGSELVLEVALSATKNDIKNVVQNGFGIEVISVRTMVIKGKRKSVGKRFFYTTKKKKKAIVRYKMLEASEKDSSLMSSEEIIGERAQDVGAVK